MGSPPPETAPALASVTRFGRMHVRLNPPNLWRLSLGGALLAADLFEGRPRYHLHSHIQFNADLAYGRYTISAYTTGGNVWGTPGTARAVWSGFAPTVLSSG